MNTFLKSLFIVTLFTLFRIGSFAQDSSHLRISLLTCSPGDELYSTFGHSGYRIIDSSKSFNDSWRDIVYNYGTFDFDDPNFYMKFVRGKLLYFVSVEDFSDFKNMYQSTNRGMVEQVLNLTSAQKINIQQFLNNNTREENKFYKYDFFFDNCTTRLRDILEKNSNTDFTKKPVMPLGTTFRQAIYQYLDKNDKAWSKLGIDILLSQKCDVAMTAEQMQFLPDNLMTSLDSAGQPIILSHQNLYKVVDTTANKTIFTPFVFFSVLLIVIAALGQLKNKWVQRFLQGFDGLLFFVTGLLGCMLVFMWFGTDHRMTKNNANLLWAWPTHLLIAFFANSTKNRVKKYFAFVAIGLVVLLLAWFFLKQHMNVALIPYVLLLIYRSASKVFFENK